MMQDKRCILVPVDGSAFSTQIFPDVRKLFPPDENEIVLLRVGQDPEGHVGRPPRLASAEIGVMSYQSRKDMQDATHPIYASQERESAVADLALDLRDEQSILENMGYDVTVEIRLDRERGPAIINYVDTHDVDAIAMTTHWRTGINKLIFGSVAQYVAQHTTVPVIMVRPE
jgi:nucleotide-binding universal stress UspA family protein